MSDEWLDPARFEGTSNAVLRKRHEAAYAFARRFAEGERVVDVACGVGYGARLLGDRPRHYLGIDHASEALRRARSRVGRRDGDFVCGDVAGRIPVAAGRAGLVLAFQIVEHIPKARTRGFLRELQRICSPGGRVILTTPNRVHRLLPFQPPWNPYHEREFARDELESVLRGVFRKVSMKGLRADGPIERVELERVRQDPLWVYSRPLFRMFPEGLRRMLERRLFPGRTGDRSDLSPSSDPAGEVTLDRFRVEEDGEGRGLDLVAVCRS